MAQKKFHESVTFNDTLSYTGVMQTGNTKKCHKVTVSQEVLDMFEKLPISRSAAIVASINLVARKPDLLHIALHHRMSEVTEVRSGNNVRVSYTREAKIEPMIDTLAQMTDLSGEQVIRLCMEAYIYKL